MPGITQARMLLLRWARACGQNLHVMPWIVDRLAPAKAAAILPVLLDDDPVGNRRGLGGRPHLTALRSSSHPNEHLRTRGRSRQVRAPVASARWCHAGGPLPGKA